MSDRVCVCPYCRALVADDRPPAHHIDNMPTVRELADLAATRKTVAMERRRSRRGPVPR